MKCKNCNEEFVQTRNTQEYCNKKECRIVRNREHRNKKEVRTNCVMCGKEFLTKSDRLTCSEACTKLQRQNERLIIKRCKNCGEEIKCTKDSQEFCNKEECKRVRDTLLIRKRKGLIEQTIKCVVCGNEFGTYYKHKNVCSKECQFKRRAQIAKKARNVDTAKVKRKEWEATPEQRERQINYMKEHRHQNIEMSRERSKRWYSSERGKEVLQQYHKEHYTYLKDTFTIENESCWKTEKVIDDTFHKLDVKHDFQVRFVVKEKDSYYVADWVLTINDEKIIVEYFGLSTRQGKIGDKYRQRMEEKIRFYKTLSDFKFIEIYPSTLKERLKEIEELTKFKLN